MTLATRRFPTAQESSSTVSLSNTTSVQEHTSSFSRSDVTGEFEVEWLLPSASGTPRQEDRVRLVFKEKDLVAGFPPAFPTDDVSLLQLRTSGKLRLGAPVQ